MTSAWQLQERTFTFLTSGPSFRIDVPTSFDAMPELSSPVRNGVGVRSFDFAPSNRDKGVDLKENELVQTLPSPYGGSVNLYRRFEEPPVWWLRWQTKTGGLYTHLREEDGPVMAGATVSNVEIVETKMGLPFLVMNSPFQFASSDIPGYQERALFFGSNLGPSFGLMLQRPSTVRTGDVRSSPVNEVGSVFSVRGGTSFEVEVRAWADNPDDANQILDAGLASIEEMN